ncbi:MAG: cystathionine gamma-synthase [Anaerolineales bacterium]|jgi:cystathionine gamma-lyase
MTAWKFDTLAIHAGQEPDPSTGAVMTPIYQTSTFRQRSVGEHLGYEYSRSGNPTRSALEANLAALEAGAHGLAFASGMAATDAVLHLLEPGDRVLAVSDLYGGTFRIMQQVFRKYGLRFDFASAIPGDTKQEAPSLIWVETPTNPMLKLYNIQEICAWASSLSPRPLVCVDNTFATPYLQRPLELGADLVLHSTTKYLGGHSDIVGGAVVVRDDALHERLSFLQNAIGGVPGPLDCFLVLRGIKTLAVRMERHAANAAAIAEFLSGHIKPSHVFYPGLKSNPQSDLAQRQMKNGGGMVSFIHSGGEAKARLFVESTRLFTLAESLGGVESLIEVPATMTHASTASSPFAVDPALIRLSVGLEDIEDLIADLDQAFQAD